MFYGTILHNFTSVCNSASIRCSRNLYSSPCFLIVMSHRLWSKPQQQVTKMMLTILFARQIHLVWIFVYALPDRNSLILIPFCTYILGYIFEYVSGRVVFSLNHQALLPDFESSNAELSKMQREKDEMDDFVGCQSNWKLEMVIVALVVAPASTSTFTLYTGWSCLNHHCVSGISLWSTLWCASKTAIKRKLYCHTKYRHWLEKWETFCLPMYLKLIKTFCHLTA